MNKVTGYLFTSESVCVGHPDKMCDFIAMSIMDDILANDSEAHVGIECAVCKDFLLIMGEVKSKYFCVYEKVAREAIKSLGYIDPSKGFSYDTVSIEVRVTNQSEEINQGVEDTYVRGKQSETQGAGDQGLVCGGAIDETPNFMPLPIELARKLTCRMTEVALADLGNPFYPDGKAQVTIRYNRGLEKLIVDTVVISIASTKDIGITELRKRVKDTIIAPVLQSSGFDIKDVKRFYINPTGSFTEFGPAVDSGLTGRKIIVDSYGMYFPAGGGSMNGKDPTKQDISGALMARYIAKNLVASGLVHKVEVQLSYAIGVENPCSVNIKCFGTSDIPTSIILRAVRQVFDLTPAGIERELNLRHPTDWNYAMTAKIGFFGNVIFPWEKTDKADELKNAIYDIRAKSQKKEGKVCSTT